MNKLDIHKAVTQLENAIKQSNEFSRIGNIEMAFVWITNVYTIFEWIEKVTDDGTYPFLRISALRIMSARFGGEYTKRYNKLSEKLTTN